MRKAAVCLLILASLVVSTALNGWLAKADVYPPGFQTDQTEQRLNILINSDGSLNPTNASIQRAGNNYSLTGNINGDITVLRNNAVLDGNGYFVHGAVVVGDWGNQQPYQPTSGLSFTSNVTVKNFNIYGGGVDDKGVLVGSPGFGVELILASHVTIRENNITLAGDDQLSPEGQTSAIDVEGGGSNLIVANNLTRNWIGMVLHETTGNLIIENNITNTHNPMYPAAGAAGFGIVFWSSDNNTVYHNNFVDNDVNAYDGTTDYSVNTWSSGFPGGGNYWSDYQTKCPNATEITNSGIWNTAYSIDNKNKDPYPLAAPYNSTFFKLQTSPPKVTIQWPMNQTVDESSVPLVFSVKVLSVDKTVDWTGYCLDGQCNITLAGDTTLTGLSSGLHRLVIYANDTFGNMGASGTLIFTIQQPMPLITALAFGGAVVTALAAVGAVIYFRTRHRTA